MFLERVQTLVRIKVILFKLDLVTIYKVISEDISPLLEKSLEKELNTFGPQGRSFKIYRQGDKDDNEDTDTKISILKTV